MSTTNKAVNFLINDANGVYIPRVFLQMQNIRGWGLDPESWAVQTCWAGPDTDGYWDAWDEILRTAEQKIGEDTYRLYQEGDLWALCYERMTDEEKTNFGFEIE